MHDFALANQMVIILIQCVFVKTAILHMYLFKFVEKTNKHVLDHMGHFQIAQHF